MRKPGVFEDFRELNPWREDITHDYFQEFQQSPEIDRLLAEIDKKLIVFSCVNGKGNDQAYEDAYRYGLTGHQFINKSVEI